MSKKKKAAVHPTRNVVIKRAVVDVLMVPLIKWMNQFDDVVTLYCCQGEARPHPDFPGIERPYVSFQCFSSARLVQLLAVFETNAETTVSWHDDFPRLTYTARFHNQKCLAWALARIKRQGG